MSLLGTLFGARRSPLILAEPVRLAIERWNAIEPDDLRSPLATQRWLVVDVETTGLNMQQDRLIAIGAVLLEGFTLRFDQSFEVVLRQSTASGSGNILIHRITGSEQTDGLDPTVALAAFLDFSRRFPCVAFHAQFDETMLKRAFKEYLGLDYSPPFIDLAFLAPALVADAPASLRSLDDWVGHYSIPILARHRAVADAVGTAQLFQLLLQRAKAKKVELASTLFKLASDQRWLAGLRKQP